MWVAKVHMAEVLIKACCLSRGGAHLVFGVATKIIKSIFSNG
jgi:hypothetical protein